MIRYQHNRLHKECRKTRDLTPQNLWTEGQVVPETQLPTRFSSRNDDWFGQEWKTHCKEWTSWYDCQSSRMASGLLGMGDNPFNYPDQQLFPPAQREM